MMTALLDRTEGTSDIIFEDLYNLENKKSIFTLVIEFLKKVHNFNRKLIKYIPILWNEDNDFYRILNLIKLELEYICTDEDKDLRIIIEHLNRYSDIHRYISEEPNILDCIFSKKVDPKIEKLEIWHLSSALKKLAKLAKGEHLKNNREVNSGL